MRSLVIAVIGAIGLGITAAEAAQPPQLPGTSMTVQIAGGCGPAFHPVPGHWSRWHDWVPPHCAPNHHGYDRPGPYYRYGTGYPYPGYPYGYRHNYWTGY
jgi:hypothetical protein